MPLATTRSLTAPITADETLKAGYFNQADATAQVLRLTMPPSPKPGASLALQKVDQSTNEVQVVGIAYGLPFSLPVFGMSAEFLADDQGRWWVVHAITPSRAVEGIVFHDGTVGGGVRPSGFRRVRWVGGTARPTNMAVGDVWERDA